MDCGSNIGISIMFFKALYPGARVIGFEPDPCSFKVLSDNVLANNLSDVELHNIALSDHDMNIEFFISPDQKGSLQMSKYRERLPGVAITVPGRHLSAFINEPIDLIKMEGLSPCVRGPYL